MFDPPDAHEFTQPGREWLLLAAARVIAFAANLAVGRRQQKEAAGSLCRLGWVSAALAVVAALPVAVLGGFSLWGDHSADWTVALASSLVGWLCAVSCLAPPVRIRGTKEMLPRVTDESFLTRVADLAARMKVPMPLVRLWPSLSGSQQAFAFAGTLQAPQLVVTDGIFHRLEQAECDAIVAHELGHIANGSLWGYAAVVPVSCAVTTALTAFMPASIAIPFGVAFAVGLRRLISRPAEFDCDHRAALAIGFRTTSSALAKIHAVNPIANSGFLPLLLFATATHPSRDARLAALYVRAPIDDRPDRCPDSPFLRNCRRTSFAALVVWLAVLAGTLAAALSGIRAPWLDLPLWMIGLTPLGLLLLGLRKTASRNRRRMGQRWRTLTLIGIGGACGTAVVLWLIASAAPAAGENAAVPGPYASSLVFSGLVFACFGLCVWLALTNGKRKLIRDVAIALQVHDFRRARDLCAKSPKIVCRSHLLRYNQAIAEAACGNALPAIEALEQLWSDTPRFPLTALALGNLLLDAGRPERAIDVARSVAAGLPDDPVPPLLEARGLRRLRRTEEAEAACQRAAAIEPTDGTVLAELAVIRLDRGEIDQARMLIDRALAAAPGEAYVLVVRAELAIQSEPVETARAAIAQAAQAIDSHPLIFLKLELRRLESRLAARLAPTPAQDIFV